MDLKSLLEPWDALYQHILRCPHVPADHEAIKAALEAVEKSRLQQKKQFLEHSWKHFFEVHRTVYLGTADRFSQPIDPYFHFDPLNGPGTCLQLDRHILEPAQLEFLIEQAETAFANDDDDDHHHNHNNNNNNNEFPPLKIILVLGKGDHDFDDEAFSLFVDFLNKSHAQHLTLRISSSVFVSYTTSLHAHLHLNDIPKKLPFQNITCETVLVPNLCGLLLSPSCCVNEFHYTELDFGAHPDNTVLTDTRTLCTLLEHVGKFSTKISLCHLKLNPEDLDSLVSSLSSCQHLQKLGLRQFRLSRPLVSTTPIERFLQDHANTIQWFRLEPTDDFVQYRHEWPPLLTSFPEAFALCHQLKVFCVPSAPREHLGTIHQLLRCCPIEKCERLVLGNQGHNAVCFEPEDGLGVLEIGPQVQQDDENDSVQERLPLIPCVKKLSVPDMTTLDMNMFSPRHSCSVADLTISPNPLNDRTLQEFGRGLRDYVLLEKLSIALQLSGETCFQHLCPASRLKELHLEFQDCPSLAWSSCLSMVLKEQQHLQSLQLAGLVGAIEDNQVPDNCRNIAALLRSHPRLLNLALYGLNSSLLGIVLEAIKENTVLTVLDLFEGSASEILEVIGAVQYLRFLKELWIPCRVAQDFYERLKPVLVQNLCICEIDRYQGRRVALQQTGIWKILVRNRWLARANQLTTSARIISPGVWPVALEKFSSGNAGELTPLFAFLQRGTNMLLAAVAAGAPCCRKRPLRGDR